MTRSVGGLVIRGDFLSIFDLKFKGIRGIVRVRLSNRSLLGTV